MDLNKSCISLHSCRICMSSCDPIRSYINIFNTKLDYKQEQINCYNMIQDIAQVTVFEEDGLPINICTQCLTDLQEAYRFKKLCQKSYQSFYEILKKDVKVEKCFDSYPEISLTDESENIDRLKDANVELDKSIEIKIEEDERHNCTHCDRVFSKRKQLLNHLTVHGLKKTFYCEICDKHYKNKAVHMKTHMTYRDGNVKEETVRNEDITVPKVKTENKPIGERRRKKSRQPFFCEICQKVFVSIEHKRIHLDVREKYKCEKCGKVYLKQSSLKTHVCESEKPIEQPKTLKKREPRKRKSRHFFCEICQKVFASTEHKRIHLEYREKYKCEKCGKAYLSPSTLKTHLEIYHAETPIEKVECPDCGKFFANEYRLKVHQIFHQGEKKFVCEFCSKSFFFKKSLDDHSLVHSDKKNHLCDRCEKKFKTKKALQIHLNRHDGIVRHRCITCSYECLTHSALTIHKRTHTKEKNYACQVCGTMFRRSDHRNRHEMTAHGLRLKTPAPVL